MAINKVVYHGTSLIDLTTTTLTSAEDVKEGVIAMTNGGELVTGTAKLFSIDFDITCPYKSNVTISLAGETVFTASGVFEATYSTPTTGTYTVTCDVDDGEEHDGEATEGTPYSSYVRYQEIATANYAGTYAITAAYEIVYLYNMGTASTACGPVTKWSTTDDGFGYDNTNFSSISFSSSTGITMKGTSNTGYQHGRNTYASPAIDIRTYLAMQRTNLVVKGSIKSSSYNVPRVALGIAPSFNSSNSGWPKDSTWEDAMKLAYPDGYALVYTDEFGEVGGDPATFSVDLQTLIDQANTAGLDLSACYIFLLQVTVTDYTAGTDTGIYTQIYFD